MIYIHICNVSLLVLHPQGFIITYPVSQTHTIPNLMIDFYEISLRHQFDHTIEKKKHQKAYLFP